MRDSLMSPSSMGTGSSQTAQTVQIQSFHAIDRHQKWTAPGCENTSTQTDLRSPTLQDSSTQTNLTVSPLSEITLGAKGTPVTPGASPEDVWLEVWKTLDVPKGEKNPNMDLVVQRSGWKTIRIFVSSTFRDLHSEREVLVKEVFPDLRAWCEARRLHLVDCDLRWGVPDGSTHEMTLRACLGEIDRCYDDNVMPFFLNMTSERVGWIPHPGQVPQDLVDEYRWIFGLSVTEMEIVHGAYRKDNPNSLFMLRDDSFLETVPQELKEKFVDDKAIAPAKLKILREMIEDRFPKDRVISYSCTCKGFNKVKSEIQLQISDDFKKKVFQFFKDRIEQQYPLLDRQVDPYQRTMEMHEAFMKNKADGVVGIDNPLQKITDYVNGSMGQDVPLLILGDQGSGKTSILASAADETLTRALNNKIPGNLKWHVFYHFVGAVAGSTDLKGMLKRLLREIQVVDDSSMPSDLESTVSFAAGALNNTTCRPVIIFIDAINQFDSNTHATHMTWMPRKLAPNVRVILSMIPKTLPHESLISREPQPKTLEVTPLNLVDRKNIVCKILGKFNKQLDMNQMITLLSKKSSENPLWLSIACEELRVFGKFREMGEKLDGLEGRLLELLEQVLSRFEEENGGHLLVACLCLLESSKMGLLESELLQILADEDNLMPPAEDSEKGEKEKGEKEIFKNIGFLPAYKWAIVYRALRTFLRPYGDSGEGRLDFYHRSLSKAVRRKYLKMPLDDQETETSKRLSLWWHKKLADFFTSSQILDRKIEEYPYHLICIRDTESLTSFLSRWDVVDKLYSKEHSSALLQYWGECGGFDLMTEIYGEMLQEVATTHGVTKETIAMRYQQIAKILQQAGIYDQALILADKALEIEQNELGQRAEKMAELYSTISYVWDQKAKQHDLVENEQLEEEIHILDNGQKAIDFYRGLQGKGKEYKSKLAFQLIRQGFTYASWADCGGNEVISISKALEKGHQHVDEAVKLCEEMKDMGKKAEAVMTRAVLIRENYSERAKLYKEALELSQQAYGEYHMLTARIYFNAGILYEDQKIYDQAYFNFRKNYEIKMQVFGPGHIKTEKAKRVLLEDDYALIGQAHGDTV